MNNLIVTSALMLAISSPLAAQNQMSVNGIPENDFIPDICVFRLSDTYLYI